ncbi:Meiosis-specific protein ASY1 [Linum perenne]
MVVAQKVKEAEITEQDSLLLCSFCILSPKLVLVVRDADTMTVTKMCLLCRSKFSFCQTRNLLRIAIFNISYIRGLFPEKHFTDKNVPALGGVYDALQKKYLKMLLFCVCEAIDGPMIEEYAFSFSYSDSDSQEVSMNFNRIGSKKKGGTFKCNSVTEITPNQMRSSACKMIRTLVQLMRTLDKMPEERTILMKLLYYDDVTVGLLKVSASALGYFENRSLQSTSHHSSKGAQKKRPIIHGLKVLCRWRLEMSTANISCWPSRQVKSVLDPCDDENEDMEENDESLGADSDDRYGSSDSDTEVDQAQEDRYIVAPAGKQQPETDTGMADEGCTDDTQDPEEDEQQLTRVKEWINNFHHDTIELTDILSNFTDISLALTEEIMDKLVNEDVVSKSGTDIYIINKQRVSYYDTNMVKDEMEEQVVAFWEKTPQVVEDDHLYMKALFHALPMTYVTIPKLQSKLDGQTSLTTVRKLMNRMTKEGYVEAKGNRKLGKRVIHSITTKKKLLEVKRALKTDSMDLDTNEPQSVKKVPLEFPTTERDNNSTCGALNSVGSDLTRTKFRSETNENGSIRTDQTVSGTREHGNTPTSKAEPVASRESFVPGGNEGAIICSRSSQDKKARKASMVEDPILQFKRQKSESSL